MWELILAIAMGVGAFYAFKAYRDMRGPSTGGACGPLDMSKNPYLAPSREELIARVEAKLRARGRWPDDAAGTSSDLKGLPRRLYIEYETRGCELSNREIAAERLHSDRGQLYVTGYCHLMEDERTFRIDKIAAMVDRHTNAAFEGGEVAAAFGAAARGVVIEPQETLEQARSRAIAAFREWARPDQLGLLPRPGRKLDRGVELPGHQGLLTRATRQGIC